MIRIALGMILGDRVKYIGLIFGVMFSTLLCVQQASIFVGALRLASSLIISNPNVDIWVARPGVEGTEWVEQMPELWIQRVRGVEGVEWAVPLYKAATIGKSLNRTLRVLQIVGVDDATLIGAPSNMLVGETQSLRQPDAVIMDIGAFTRLLPGKDPRTRPTIEIGKRMVVVVGVCRELTSLTGNDIIYARRSVAVNLSQEPNDTLTFGLVKALPGRDHRQLASLIARQTGLQAFTASDFKRQIVQWTLDNTGVIQVLGSVILLGLVIGILVVGQTFYLFAYENQRYFATLKAMGASNGRIVGMIVVQAMLVTAVGYGLGVGGATFFLRLGDTDLSPLRGITLSAEVAIIVAIIMPIMVLGTALVGGRRALFAEPGMVFR
ncbi:MAG: ABC transporter permease [Planctomycetota bacterium]|nr:ABC transporter permease [Planctomycetota bacterium]